MQLGQPAEDVIIPSGDTANQRNISGLVLPVTRDISQEGRLMLCKALEEEYIAYFRLIKLSENMNDQDLEFCRNIAQRNCPNLDTTSMIQHL